MIDLQQLFEVKFNRKLEESSQILADAQASFQLEIGDYICHLDLSDERRIKPGPHPKKVDCWIQMNEKNFEKLMTGKLNIPFALATRAIKVGGNLMLFAKLRELFNA